MCQVVGSRGKFISSISFIFRVKILSNLHGYQVLTWLQGILCFGRCLKEEPYCVCKHILLQVHTIDCMVDLKIRPIRQVLVEDGLFLEWYAIDRCLISLSLPPIFLLLPINDLDGPNHFENIVPISLYRSKMQFRHAIKIIIELLTSVPMSFNQEAPVPKVTYLSRTFQERRYGAIHAHCASRPTFDLS